MAKNLSNLRAPQGANSNKKRVGRGMGSGIGKTSGRGHKGQGSRSGSRLMRGFEGGQMPLHRRLPKRGFTNIFRTEYFVLGLSKIQELATENPGAEITLELLEQRGIVKGRKLVKVLANGELTVAVTVHANKFSEAAKKKIEAAGGSIVIAGGGTIPVQ